jgi:hypothetical protein
MDLRVLAMDSAASLVFTVRMTINASRFPA